MSESTPIQFSPELIPAIMRREKTETRRMAWRPPSEEFLERVSQTAGGVPHTISGAPARWQALQAGQTLWVREPWRVHASYDDMTPSQVLVAMGGDTAGCVDYQASARSEPFWGKWRNARFLPRDMARLWLSVEAVRMEPLQAITEEAAIAEGARLSGDLAGFEGEPPCNLHYSTAREWFGDLWDHLHGAGSWDSNPEVVVIQFRLLAIRGWYPISG